LISSNNSIARRFFSSNNAASYEKIVKFATFGRDSIWKRTMSNLLTKDHCYLLDLACGTGILSYYIPKVRDHVILGSDLTPDYLLHAKRKSRYSLLTNSIAEVLPFRPGIFDAILSSYLAKYVDLRTVVREHWRLLKRGGLVVFHDFTLPKRKFVRQIWNSYFLLLNQVGRIIKNWRVVLSELDDVIVHSEWVKNLMRELQQVGFESITCKYYTWGTSAIVTGLKP
jgi:demethylmenaquinone methyltransferase/2-methoxy-6-polyprenyl-1,4-benzoquinol methylase